MNIFLRMSLVSTLDLYIHPHLTNTIEYRIEIDRTKCKNSMKKGINCTHHLHSTVTRIIKFLEKYTERFRDREREWVGWVVEWVSEWVREGESEARSKLLCGSQQQQQQQSRRKKYYIFFYIVDRYFPTFFFFFPFQLLYWTTLDLFVIIFVLLIK
jgi:hypothetical protein